MNAVGIDVSKGKSMVSVIRPFGELVAKPFEVRHTSSELSELARRLKSLEGETRVLKTWRNATKERDYMRAKKTAFSKVLLIQESILIWMLSLSFVALAFLCVFKEYTGGLPWLAVTLTGAWTAYGVSQAMYYNKSKAENTQGGIVYERAVNSSVDCD